MCSTEPLYSRLPFSESRILLSLYRFARPAVGHLGGTRLLSESSRLHSLCSYLPRVCAGATQSHHPGLYIVFKKYKYVDFELYQVEVGRFAAIAG